MFFRRAGHSHIPVALVDGKIVTLQAQGHWGKSSCIFAARRRGTAPWLAAHAGTASWLESHGRCGVLQPAAKSNKLMLLNLFLSARWNFNSSRRPKALGRAPFVTRWTRRGRNLVLSVHTIVKRSETKKF